MVGRVLSGPIVQDPSDHRPHSAVWSHPLPEGPPGLGRGPGRGGRASRFQRPLKQPATLAASLTHTPHPSPLPLLAAGTEHTSPIGRHWWWTLAEAWGWPEEGSCTEAPGPARVRASCQSLGVIQPWSVCASQSPSVVPVAPQTPMGQDMAQNGASGSSSVKWDQQQGRGICPQGKLLHTKLGARRHEHRGGVPGS